MKRYHHLTRDERYVIEKLLGIGKNFSQIAEELGFHRSSISREIRRHASRKGHYSAHGAYRQTIENRAHPICYDPYRKIRDELEAAIRDKLMQAWSPEQISNRLKLEWGVSISHEAIYRYIYTRTRMGENLHHCLRRFGRWKRKRGTRRRGRLAYVEGRKFIEQRPASAQNRKLAGHWERDLVEGKKGRSSLLTIVDRKTRYTLIRKVQNKTVQCVDETTQKALDHRRLPKKTITNDNGPEFSGFRELQKRMGIPIYYTHPYHAWERGTNENTNGLIRQYFPRGMDISILEDKQIKRCERELNSRPRKVLKYRTPKEVLFKKIELLIPTKTEYRRLIQQAKAQDEKHLRVALGC